MKSLLSKLAGLACLALMSGSASAASLITMAAPAPVLSSGAFVSGDAVALASAPSAVRLDVVITGDVDGVEEFYDISLNGVAIGKAGKAFGGSVTGGAHPFTLKQSFAISKAFFNSTILAGANALGFFGFDASSTVGIGGANRFTGTVFGSISAVPEPTSMAILGLGTCALVGFARRRK